MHRRRAPPSKSLIKIVRRRLRPPFPSSCLAPPSCWSAHRERILGLSAD